MVWEDGTLGNSEVLFRASNDSGRTFGNIINISNDSADSSQPPQIAAIGDNVYVVRRSFNIDNNDILFASSNDNGQTFITPVNLSNSPGDSQFARIAAAGDNVYVVWEDRPSGNADISYTVSNNSGLTFSPPINLSNSLGNSINPDISTSGDKVYVVWQDDTLGNFDIFFIAIDDNGITVGSKLNLSNNIGSSENSQIASSGNSVYAVWQNFSPGNYDIFFRGNTQLSNEPDLVNLSNSAGLSIDLQITAN